MKHHKYSKEWHIIWAAITVVIISAIADYFTTNFNWFTRSGSVAVLLAAFVEFKISSHIYDEIQRAQFMQKRLDMYIPFKAKPTKEKEKVSLAAHILLVAGTIIWGYGDLFWS